MTYVTCLNHMSFHLLTIVRRGSCGSTRKLLLLCTQLLLVFLLQVPDVEKFLFPESASRVHVSQQQRRMEVTRDLYTLNLLAKLVLHHHILFSLSTATIVEAVLKWTSPEQVPSFHRVAPWYLKLVASSIFWRLMLMFALMLFVLLVMILFFSVLTSIPYAVVFLQVWW